MFNDPRPLAGYGETAGWAIPLEPSPMSKPLKRPPILKTYSSTSSILTGMEQALVPGARPPRNLSANSSKSSLHISVISATRPKVPNLRDFVKCTPPPDDTKPLPPTPLRYRRNSYDSSPATTSRDASPVFRRRTSSIYSRTVSQWIPESPVWISADFDEPVPAIPHELLLRPIAYSASTPQLVEKSPTPPLLEPRAYQPLIVTPSPSVSRATTPSPPPNREGRLASVLLPTALQSLEIRQEHLRTVSLEKAKANSQAPGAKHFLPEELRAQSHGKTLSKSRSFEHFTQTSPRSPIVRDTMAMFSSDVETPLWDDSLTLTLTDAQGRDRVVGSPRASVAPLPTLAFPLDSPTKPEFGASFAVGSHAPKPMVPLAKLNTMPKVSRDKVAQALGIDDLDELRGRPMQRGPRSLDYGHYMPGASATSTTSSVKEEEEEEEDDAHAIAREYHALLSAQYRAGTPSSNVSNVGSDKNVIEHIRMAPQPLFSAKQQATQAGVQKDRYNSMAGSVSPHRREQSDSGFSMRSGSLGYSSKPTLPPLSFRPEAPRRSTSGSIPISPPSEYFPISLIAMAPIPQARVIQRHRRNSDDNRISAYFPITTKGNDTLLFRRSNEKKPSLPQPAPTPISPTHIGRPALTSPMIPERGSSTQSSNFPHPSFESHYSETPSNASPRYDVRPHEKEQTAKQALLSKFTKGAVKYADILTRPTGCDETRSRRKKSAASATSERSEKSASGKKKPFHNPFKPKAKAPKLPNLHILPVNGFTGAKVESPHLYPSPPGTQNGAPRMNLGWSSEAKSAFDAATSPTVQTYSHSNTFGAGRGYYEHTPSRPIDARPSGYTTSAFSPVSPDSPPAGTRHGRGANGEGAGGRRPSGLAGLIGIGGSERKQAKAAERRREDVKRSIRVVGLEEQGMSMEVEVRPGFVRRITGGMI